jgi:hypothetical protein
LAKGFFTRAHNTQEKDAAGIIATTGVYKMPTVTVTG